MFQVQSRLGAVLVSLLEYSMGLYIASSSTLKAHNAASCFNTNFHVDDVISSYTGRITFLLRNWGGICDWGKDKLDFCRLCCTASSQCLR